MPRLAQGAVEHDCSGQGSIVDDVVHAGEEELPWDFED